MSQLIFATVGISIIHNYIRNSEEKDTFFKDIQGHALQETTPGLTELKPILQARLLETYETAIRTYAAGNENWLSAEIVTLHIMKKNNLINPETDAVALLHSDTLDSKLAAELNRDLLLKKIGFSSVKLYRLEKINGKDGNTFSQMVNSSKLSGLLDRISEDFDDKDQAMFCFSGGYKGLIPIITAYAREYDMNMYCMFERSNSLIQYKFGLDGSPETAAFGDMDA
jgi:CRISPR/Cas system-associated protein Csm6